MSSVQPHLHAQKPSIPIARQRSNTAGSSSSTTTSTTSVDLDPGVSNEYSPNSYKEYKSSHALPPIDTGTIRCICRISDDDGFTIQCDKCLVWQHAFCVNIDKHNIPDQYLCDMCDPIPRYYNVKRAIEHQTKRAQAERKAESEERRGGKRNLSPSSSGSHRKKPSSDDNSLKRRKRSDGADKTHPKRPASFGLKRKASDDTTEMWESALKQALSSAFNKADSDSGPDKKQKTGHVTITKYENSRESSPLTPRTVEHTSRFDFEDARPPGKQSPVYKSEIKMEEEKANVHEKPSNIDIPTRKMSADSTESINVTSPSPTRTSPPPSIAFSTAGQDASATESGDENVDIDGDVLTNSTQSRSPHAWKKARPNADDAEASVSPKSSAASDNEDTSDESSKHRKQINSGNKPSNACLDKDIIMTDTSNGSLSSGTSGLRKLKTLPLNLPCKKLWMRNYLRESSKKISEEQEPLTPKNLEHPVSSPLPHDTMESLTEAKLENEAETVVDILGDDKDTIENTLFQDVNESAPAEQEHDIVSDNESNASTVPAEDLAERSALLPDATPASDENVNPNEDVIENGEDHLKQMINAQASKDIVDYIKPSETVDEAKAGTEMPLTEQPSNSEKMAPNEPASAAEEVPVTDQESLLESVKASQEVKQHDTSEQGQQQDATEVAKVSEASLSETELEVQPPPKVVRLSVKEYLSQRAAAAQRGDETEKPSSTEQQPSAASPPLANEATAAADSI